MRIYFLVVFAFLSNFVFAKKDDIPEHPIHFYDNFIDNSDSCTINTSKGKISFKLSDANDLKESSLINSLDLQEQLIVEAIVKECVCRQTYQMTGKEKERLLSSEYQDIVHKLLGLDHLSDQNIWKLWEEYKQRHRLRFGSNSKYEQELKDQLAKRKKERDKQVAKTKRKEQEHKKKIEVEELEKQREQQRIREQKQAALVKKYNQNILDNSEYISSYYQSRQQALKETIEDGGKQHIKTYDIDAQTQALLQMQGINHHQFKSLASSIFGHQLFQECADHYKKSAKIVFEYGLKNSTLIPHLINFTQAAFQGTKYEEFALAIELSNVAELLANFSVGACKGAIEKVCNFIDLFRDPKQLVIMAKHLTASLIRITQTLGGALAAYDQEGIVGVTNLQACQESFGNDIALFNQVCGLSREHFLQWYQKSSVQDKGQVATGIVIDLTVTPFLMCKAMKACGGILMGAKNSLKLERAIELAEELGMGFQEAEELLLATEAGIQKLPATTAEIEVAMISLMESEINIAIKGLELPILQKLAPFIEEFRKMGGVIHLKDKIFKNQFKEVLKILEEELKNPILEQLKKLYGKKNIENKNVRVHLDYICNFELKLKESKKFGGYILDVKGGHLPGVCEAFEQTGLVKIISKQKLKTGGVHYVMQDAFTGKPIEKTVFLEGWNEEKIAKAVWDIYCNDSEIFICDNGKFTKIGIIDGCELNIYWDSSNNNGKIIEEIVTCLPVKE
ncbi:MAG: hypothetical protein HYU67_13795 [Flavobacteriia bacterium]|nr:hypothetical protein [Flavobacteriia bacterium]